jgi:hypothetical protein
MILRLIIRRAACERETGQWEGCRDRSKGTDGAANLPGPLLPFDGIALPLHVSIPA